MANILIVDDSMFERNILCDIMTSLGHNVIGQATSGEEAVEEYLKLRPDLVTMDLTMKGLGGAEAISKIIAQDPEARIVVVSSHQKQQVILDALERGGRHYIIKPMSRDDVATVINNVLEQSFDKDKHHELLGRIKHCTSEQKPSPKHHAARILIADDSAFARQVLKDVVTDLGHIVVGEATNGAQAFAGYAKLKPDLITMDLTMQGVGGAEAISKIMALYPDARIIVISATESRASILDALARGARHFIVKPIRQEKVANVIETVLQQNFDAQLYSSGLHKLQAHEELHALVEPPEQLPPYFIIPKDNNFIHICINHTLTSTSFLTLMTELTEYMENRPTMLLDFGTTERLDLKLVVRFNKLVQTMENNAGFVQATSNNQGFVDFITNTEFETTSNQLAEILTYSEISR